MGSINISSQNLAGNRAPFLDGVPNVHDALVNNASGLLGRFMNVIMNVVFPYIILGSLFGKSAGGKVLIKLAFRWTRNLRGGPAHAAIVSSAMFGTISGGPVVNVLSTGVLTIPMMIKRGFSKVFRGRDGGGRIFGRINHAPCDGRCGLCLGCNDGGAISRGDYRRSLAGAGLFPVPVPYRVVPIAQTGDRSIRRIYRRYVHFTHRAAAPLSNRVANIAYLAIIAYAQGLGGLRFPGWITGADAVMQGDRCSVSNLNWGMQIFQTRQGMQGPQGGGLHS